MGLLRKRDALRPKNYNLIIVVTTKKEIFLNLLQFAINIYSVLWISRWKVVCMHEGTLLGGQGTCIWGW